MRIKLDENMPVRLVTSLGGMGNDVETVNTIPDYPQSAVQFEYYTEGKAVMGPIRADRSDPVKRGSDPSHSYSKIA